ncbi:DUF2085 domain-containing protein [Romeria aff. gracilis LEGE 07310]|uniref:DUF2085 domain-containing protein n=1 Tax=Vasconcelosia minhoensis LEGE 07310 TaxID=915328 RepID=A0A8J7A8T1_9CYAN|nr:DUF2085 domain-containing protein [Romeria gracilis]MBE9079322.1 DUF2085 domain-containing protein [Romeria aff. gracilis LEGE 07310]
MHTASISKPNWPSLLADIVLVGMASGPLAAPFLASANLPLLPQIADIIYWMGMHVCPQPDMGIALSPPQIMAVCMRCYGTVTGLVLMRLLYRQDGGQAAYWLHQYGILGFVLTIGLCLMYPAELVAQQLGWWGYSNWIVTPFGLLAGLGLGAYIMPLLHRNVNPKHSEFG